MTRLCSFANIMHLVTRLPSGRVCLEPRFPRPPALYGFAVIGVGFGGSEAVALTNRNGVIDVSSIVDTSRRQPGPIILGGDTAHRNGAHTSWRRPAPRMAGGTRRPHCRP